MPYNRITRPRPRRAALTAAMVLAAAAFAGSAAWPPAAAALTASAVSIADTLDSRPPVIDVVYPAGGELFTGSDVETLRWTIDEQSWDEAATPVTLQLFDGGALLDEATVSPDPDGVYAHPWTVGDVATATARLRVSAVDRFGWAAADSGDVFTIEPSGTATPPLAIDRLGPVVPNPFNPSTRIHFSLKADADIELAVYDLRGRAVARLASGAWPAGRHDVRWLGVDGDGAAVASGAYFARLNIHGEAADLVTRLTLVR